MSLILLDNQKVTLSVQPVDAAGNPAPVDGAPAWELVNESPVNVLTLEVATDGMSCVASTLGPLGTAQVKVTADARLGPDVRSITGLINIEVQAGEAVALNIAAGTPEDK